jgi:hypothetical protein
VPSLESPPDLLERSLDVALPRQPRTDCTAEAGKLDGGFRSGLGGIAHDCRVVTGAACCDEDDDDEPVELEPVDVEPVDVEPAAPAAVPADFFLLAPLAGATTAAWLFLPSAGS